MNHDSQLLRTVARFAGITVLRDAYEGANQDIWCGLMVDEDDARRGNLWNPLTDDGDRLRLARRLGMVLDYSELGDNEVRFWMGNDECARALEFDPNVPGEEGRAVVNAALLMSRSVVPADEEESSGLPSAKIQEIQHELNSGISRWLDTLPTKRR